ncbi:MAG TPA: hypothetical protein VIT44_12030 [Cyclobacteriaceae bacterium]
MKQTINKIALSILILVVAFACSDESRIPEFENGPNVRIILDPSSAKINSAGDLSQVKIKFELHSENNDLNVVDLRVQRNGTGTPASVIKFTQADFDNGGQIIKGAELTLSQVADALDLPGGLADFKSTDKLTFFNFTTMMNGVIYPSPTIGNGNTNLSSAIKGANATTSFTSYFEVVFN